MNRWFHPNLSNDQAEHLLLKLGQDGSFLVRPSKSCSGQFSLSVRRKNKVTHIKIRKTNDKRYDLHGGQQFNSLTELIQHYQENSLREKDGEVFELKQPLIPNNKSITERWFHGPISGLEAEKLIREKGLSGSFLIRESQSKPGDFVLTVRNKDESSQTDKITHVMIRHHNGKYDVGGGEKFNSLQELVEHYKRNPMVETTGTVVNMKYPFNATRIIAKDIDARVRELSREFPIGGTSGVSGGGGGIGVTGAGTAAAAAATTGAGANNLQQEGFWEEFEHLQHQECKVLYERKIGQEDRNLLKNRHKNILPYDYTRVILRKPVSSKNDDNNSNNNSDYINANYIRLVHDDTTISPRTKHLPNSKIYIATQGPLQNTVNDFWWMVWQERSCCIVMVTKEIERGKIKCHRYWPTLEQSILECGPLEIKILSDTANPNKEEDYIVREFEIRSKLSGDENSDCHPRRVTQYQYLAWPDQSIPSNSTSVLNFLQIINNRLSKNNALPSGGPMIVHCSAGIGRSGTLIVIDMLMDQLNHHGENYEIDIQRIVKITRAQRSGLVQTETQYKFIYVAIQNYIAWLRHNSWHSKQQQNNTDNVEDSCLV